MEYIEPTQDILDKAVELGYTISECYNGKPMFERENCVVQWRSLDDAWSSRYLWEQSGGGNFVACEQYYATLEHALERESITDQTNRTFASGEPYKRR